MKARYESMDRKFLVWLKPTLWAIVLGVVSNIAYWILTIYMKNLKLDYRVGIFAFVVACLLVTTFQSIKYHYLLRELGVIRTYDKAKETTQEGLQEATESYWWLGTSAYYVLCTPHTREQYIETKHLTDFVFVTVDSECPAALSEQAQWERRSEDEVAERIAETKKVVHKLRQKGVNIAWEGHSTFPTFRIVIVNRKKVLVSFYERGKLGPDCKQLALEANGLLGQWFVQFFEKSRSAANRMRIERRLGRLLFSKANIDKNKLLEELKILCPEDDVNRLEQVVEELTPGTGL